MQKINHWLRKTNLQKMNEHFYCTSVVAIPTSFIIIQLTTSNSYYTAIMNVWWRKTLANYYIAIHQIYPLPKIFNVHSQTILNINIDWNVHISSYFQCVSKPSDDLPDPNGLLSTKLPSSAQQAKNHVSPVSERKASVGRAHQIPSVAIYNAWIVAASFFYKYSKISAKNFLKI